MSFSFKAEAVQEQQYQEEIPVPAGQHTLVIYDHAYKENANKNGYWLRLHFEVKGGAASGQTFVQFYNVQHANETAEHIAKQELSSLCRAGGIDGFGDPDELIGLEFDAVVKIKVVVKENNEKEERNEIVRYLTSSNKPAPAPAAAAAQPAAASEKRPWEK